jgi:hypothetical protein
MTLTFAERYSQARLYAAQMRARREMGDAYAHAKNNHIKNRRLRWPSTPSKTQTETSGAA